MTTQPTCRCCGKPLEVITQPALLATQTPRTYVTCWQPGCSLYGFTLLAEDYETADLSLYCGVKSFEDNQEA